MKKHWMKALIALMVMAALLAPAAVAEGLVSVDAAQEPIDTGTVETYAEQTVVLGGDGPLTGLAVPRATARESRRIRSTALPSPSSPPS